MLHHLLFLAFVATGAVGVPTFPQEYSALIKMNMPYIPLEMPIRVLTSATTQKVEFYDGLEVDVHSARGTYKYVFNNSRRVCSYSPPVTGPTLHKVVSASGEENEADAWKAMPFLPDLSQYTYKGDELVGGIMCEKYTMDAHHGSTGTMDDHLAFYWDPVLSKPVRWRQHSRHVTFGSHTDEYIMDYLSFQSGAPSAAELSLPEECHKQPQLAEVSIQIGGFLEAIRAKHAAPQGAINQNLLLVQDLNRQHAGRASFRGNQFLHMTPEEVLSYRGGKNKGSSRAERRTQEHLQYIRAHDESNSAQEVPVNFDWRTARPGSVSAVKDQAVCGSCWTYGVTEPIESILAIRTGNKIVELPEQFVVDCTWTNGAGSSGMNSGCDGGDSDIGALEIIRKFGGVIPSAAAYGSYLSVNGFCKDTRLMQVGAKITAWVDIAKRSEQAMLQALYTVGPLQVSIQVPQEMLYYDSGVLNVESCRHNESEIDHAVTATGFGKDEHGTPYYTIRNSWSTYWGDQGYINIARGELDCCVSCEAGYADVEAVAAVSDIVV